jgi:alpha-beta hydrolase superfamily lysophospholipase
VQTYFKGLQDEAYLDMLVFNLPRPKRVRTPMLMLGAERDAIFTHREVARTARAYSADTKVIPGMAHDMMVEPAWRDVADVMLAWLVARGL